MSSVGSADVLAGVWVHSLSMTSIQLITFQIASRENPQKNSSLHTDSLLWCIVPDLVEIIPQCTCKSNAENVDWSQTEIRF